MKKLFLLLLLFVFYQRVQAAEVEYRYLKDYAYMTYNILESYVNTHPDAPVQEIRRYIRCEGCKVIMKDARDMGYDRMVVIRCCYHIAMEQKEQNKKILAALLQEIQSYKTWRDIAYWGGLSCSVFSTICCFPLLYMTGKMYQEYLRT